MKIFGNGLDYKTGRSLLEPIEEEEFARGIEASLAANAPQLRRLKQGSGAGATYRGEVERLRTPDLGDPVSVGWTYLINGSDPRRDQIVDAIKPLAMRRGMTDPAQPTIFNAEPEEQWFEWLLANRSSLDGSVPYYVLIIGGPDMVPFRFQSLLASGGAVGRLDVDTIDDLRAYVDKVMGCEKSSAPVTRPEAICFAPDPGPQDATYFSRRYMAEPLAQHIRDDRGIETTTLFAQDATKVALSDALNGAKPALVYTASHGVGAADQPFDIQKAVNGAICCQQTGDADWLFAATDVPSDKPFLEGSVFFQFACFGYGTPAESDFTHWLGQPQMNTSADFVAALPKRLLSHPRGPLAFVGHVDTAWLHGFADPKEPHILEKWSPRMEPFVLAVDSLLDTQPIGLALASMSKRYDIGNALLTSAFDRIQRGTAAQTPEFQSRLVDTFITRSDAQNYHILGDPAVRLRLL